MNANLKLAERVAVLATLDPASQSAGTAVTAWVSASNFHRFCALIETGVLGASATVDAKLRQAQDSSGTGAKDISGKSIAQIVKASGDNKQAFLECQADDLDANNGFSYIGLSVTVGTAASLVGAQLLGVNPRFAPASDFNQAAVAQLV